MSKDRDSSIDYWKSRAGEDYREQQTLRTQSGYELYQAQENWLLEKLTARASNRSSSLAVLDFGCGFGRLAGSISRIPNLTYYGYDFSEAMARELLNSPPPTIDDPEAQIKIAKDIKSAFPERSFDVIFTVSVLIHNRTDRARDLVSQMSSKLNEGGVLFLLENLRCSVSTRTSGWHGGCWFHNYPKDIAPDMDIDMHVDALQQQCIYELKKTSEARQPIVRYVYSDGSNSMIEMDQFLLDGLAALESIATGLEVELASEGATRGTVHDLRERLDTLLRERDELKQDVRLLDDRMRALSETLHLARVRLREFEDSEVVSLALAMVGTIERKFPWLLRLAKRIGHSDRND